MRKVQSFQDLEQFGIDALTGESCGYAMRILCDVTEQGKALVEAFFGNTVEIKENSNWNNGTKENPHVGSIMLPREGFVGPFGAFCLLQTRTQDSLVVSLKDDYGNYPVEYEAEEVARLRELAELSKCSFEEYLEKWGGAKGVARYYARPTEHDSDRNRHAMSGRLI